VRLRELAEARRRFGYRRLQILLQREGWQVNHKRIHRLYVEEKLSLRRKRGRKHSRVRQPLPEAVAGNQVWSVDFMTDALSSGRRFRMLNIVDDYTRECQINCQDMCFLNNHISHPFWRLATGYEITKIERSFAAGRLRPGK